MNWIQQTYGLSSPTKSAKASAIAICDCTKKLDWLWQNKISPFWVRRYIEKTVDVHPKGNQESCIYGSKLTETRERSSHRDDGLLCTTFKTTDQERIEVNGMRRKVMILETYDKVDAQARIILKHQTMNALMEWMRKQGK